MTTYYIDATTYLLNKITTTASSAQGQNTNVELKPLSNYQKTDFGLLTPFKVDIDLGQVQLGYVAKSVTVNKDIDPKVFDMPGK